MWNNFILVYIFILFFLFYFSYSKKTIVLSFFLSSHRNLSPVPRTYIRQPNETDSTSSVCRITTQIERYFKIFIFKPTSSRHLIKITQFFSYETKAEESSKMRQKNHNFFNISFSNINRDTARFLFFFYKSKNIYISFNLFKMWKM